MKHNENFEGTKQLKNHETGEKLVLKKFGTGSTDQLNTSCFFI